MCFHLSIYAVSKVCYGQASMTLMWCNDHGTESKAPYANMQLVVLQNISSLDEFTMSTWVQQKWPGNDQTADDSSLQRTKKLMKF